MIIAGKYSPLQKLFALRREIATRERIYPHLIVEGTMRQSQAEYEIDIMRAIADDYRTTGVHNPDA